MSTDKIKEILKQSGADHTMIDEVVAVMKSSKRIAMISELQTMLKSDTDQDEEVQTAEWEPDLHSVPFENRYEFLALGEGGMGSVHKVKDKLLRRTLA